MKQILCCLILIALAASAFSATSKTIPELNKLNNGLFTNDYSVTYNNPVLSGEFGVSSEAGDINNDGVPDFMIGNPANDNNKGIAYIIYGKRGTLRQFNSMNDFQPSDGFIIKGAVVGQKLGFSLSDIGDVNGDGISDIIIGSPSWSNSYASEAGMAYVLFGRRSSSEFPSVVDVDRLSSSQGFKIYGEGSKSRAGFSVSGGVDVNGDGVSDIIIGAIGAGSGGSTYVVYGNKQSLTDMTLPPVQGKGFTIQGSNREDFGSSVSKIGDFNGDGVDDLIVGAHVANNWAGKAYIIYGRRGGFPLAILATDGMTLEGMYSEDQFGCMVSNAGDFNGDGLQDVIIGAYGANVRRGGAYVIMGSRTNPSVLNMRVTDTANARGFNLMSSLFSQMSMSVSGGRDINGDGRSDIIIGAPSYNKENGGVYVIYGSSNLVNFWLDNPLTPQQGFSMFGTQEGSRYGQFVRMLKDVNGDGLDDFIVGAFNANGKKGAANLFYLPWSCPAQCLSCTKPNTCDSWVCPNKCKKCSAGPNICDAWICPDKCARCSSASTCDAWICPENCSKCSNADVCEGCNSGFGIVDDKCASCPSDTHIMNNGFCIEVRSSWDLFKDFLSKLF